MCEAVWAFMKEVVLTDYEAFGVVAGVPGGQLLGGDDEGAGEGEKK